MPNFQEILNEQAASIKPPKPIPMGNYLCLVDGTIEYAAQGKNNNPAAIVRLKPIQAMPDVDQHDLMTALDGQSLGDRVLRNSFWMTHDAKHHFTRFLIDALGIEPGTKTVGELANEAPGKQVICTVVHTPAGNGVDVYANVKGFAHV